MEHKQKMEAENKAMKDKLDREASDLKKKMSDADEEKAEEMKILQNRLDNERRMLAEKMEREKVISFISAALLCPRLKWLRSWKDRKLIENSRQKNSRIKWRYFSSFLSHINCFLLGRQKGTRVRDCHHV